MNVLETETQLNTGNEEASVENLPWKISKTYPLAVLIAYVINKTSMDCRILILLINAKHIKKGNNTESIKNMYVKLMVLALAKAICFYIL